MKEYSSYIPCRRKKRIFKPKKESYIEIGKKFEQNEMRPEKQGMKD